MALRRVSIIGSGNWGSTIAKIIGNNVVKNDAYDNQVKMWVFEEMINDRKLTEIINQDNENVKYLPGIKLPKNVVAIPDVAECTKDADILIFVIPHQFLGSLFDKMKPNIKPGAIGVTLIKGLGFNKNGKIALISDLIRESLNIPCAVLMGANLATEVSKELFCEATVAFKDKTAGNELKSIFETNYFRITVVEDEVTTELCGALKNIVAIAAGVANGMGYGDNTTAAIIRLGFMEMKAFIYEFFVDRKPVEATLMESCGFADLVTTCFGGRNRKIGEALVTHRDKSVPDLEKMLLNGQSAQGPLTADEVHVMLKQINLERRYPLFTAVHRICKRELAVEKLIDELRNHPAHE